MGARIPDQTRHAATRATILAFVAGAVLGAVVAGGAVFLGLHRDPNQPGTGPCAEAAERWAQVDETAKWEYWEHPQGRAYIPSDGLVIARGEARAALEACRAAGS
jgi:hypothetical protein